MHHQTQQHSYRNMSGVNHLEGVEKDINSHVQEIEGKVLSIINNLISLQLNQWDARPPVPSQAFRIISRYGSVPLTWQSHERCKCHRH
jgi:vacuolar protein sorting-associated protein 54